MLSKSPSLREIRYREKRRQLLETAARLFAQKGYEKVSLDEIAARLKLTKASLYYYFKSKDEIFFLIQMDAIEQANAGLEKVLAMKAGPEEKLKEAIKNHVRIVTRDYVTGTFRQKELVLPGRFMNRLVEMRDRFEKKLRTNNFGRNRSRGVSFQILEIGGVVHFGDAQRHSQMVFAPGRTYGGGDRRGPGLFHCQGFIHGKAGIREQGARQSGLRPSPVNDDN